MLKVSHDFPSNDVAWNFLTCAQHRISDSLNTRGIHPMFAVGRKMHYLKISLLHHTGWRINKSRNDKTLENFIIRKSLFLLNIRSPYVVRFIFSTLHCHVFPSPPGKPHFSQKFVILVLYIK